MTTTETNSAIKAIKFNGYKIELSENRQGKPVARLSKFLTVGKNKGTYKLINGYYFASEQRRQEWIKEQMTTIKGRIAQNEAINKAKKDATANHTFKVNDVLYQSWGYDQTNIDFFQIVEILPKSVKVRPISALSVPNTQGMMCENVKPDINNFTGMAELKPVKCYISSNNDNKASYYIPNGRHHLSLYTYGEKGVYQSWYA